MFYYIGYFLVSLWIADFITGCFHWLEDTYCTENMPLIGGFICEPNIDHHIDPQLMVRTGSFISRNIFQWGLALSVLLILWLFGFATPFLALTLLLSSFGNEVHRWNHMNKDNNFVAFIKETGLIQLQKQHSLHHKPPHTQYYCVLTSQVNPVLERLNFWRRLEWLMSFTGIHPKREDRRDSIENIKQSRETLKKKQ